MGIDPVTHAPLLDLFDISSVLSSSALNMFGVQPLVNPDLLRVAASLLSSQQNQNHNLVHQNVQENQIGHPHQQVQGNSLAQLQNQNHQTLIQETPSCAPFNNSNCLPFTRESLQLMEPNVNQLPSSFSQFDQQTSHSNDWVNNLDNFISNEGYQQLITHPQLNLTSCDFDMLPHLSNISTRSSSPTSLNSLNSDSTICINRSNAEDERDISYCSNELFKYEYQDILNATVLM